MKKLLLLLLLIPNLVMADVKPVTCEYDCSNCKTFQDRYKILRAFPKNLELFLAKTYENRAYENSEAPQKLQRLTNFSGGFRFQEYEIEDYYEYKKIYLQLEDYAQLLPLQNKTKNGRFDSYIGAYGRAFAIDSLFKCSINDKKTLNAYLNKLKGEKSY